MARTFNGTTDTITCSIGANGVFGGTTVAGVIRLPASVSAVIRFFAVGTATSGTAKWSVGVSAAAAWQATIGTATPNSVTLPTLGRWYCFACSKTTGTTTPRFHWFDYTTWLWAHEDAASTAANSGSPATSCYIGSGNGGTTFFWPRDVAQVGVWPLAMTDTQIEQLATDLTYSNWYQAAGATIPLGIWPLDQPSTGTTVVDRTGRGANQTAIAGTTVTADDHPLFNRSVVHAASPSWAA